MRVDGPWLVNTGPFRGSTRLASADDLCPDQSLGGHADAGGYCEVAYVSRRLPVGMWSGSNAGSI